MNDDDDSGDLLRDDGTSTAAAWSTPSISLTVTTPLVSADASAPTATVPTVALRASIPVIRDAGGTTCSFVDGVVVYSAAGADTATGALHLEFASEGPFETEYDEDEFSAAGWTRVPGPDRAVCFRGAAIRDGQSRPVPRFRWRGPVTAKGRVSADVRAESPDAAAEGVSVRLP
nr:hypothetical protein [Microbacterium lemovicicum]